MFVFTSLLGMKDGGYLGLPLSGAFGVRAEEKLPFAHNRLASTPVSQKNPKSTTLDFSRSFSKHNTEALTAISVMQCDF